jgi:hydroxymethylbilane synthase
MTDSFKLGTRGSQLALTQSQQVADVVAARTGSPVELVIIKTRGDLIKDTPLPEIGGKGLFTLELERALISGDVDFAVHSLKDLPTTDPEGLILGAIPERVDPRDAIVGPDLAELREGDVVGSGSLRRRLQLLSLRPDLVVHDIRGNVPTRIAKRDAGQYRSTILAMAGMKRLQIQRPDIHPIAIEDMVPAVGQGALAVQCRAGDERVLGALSSIDHAETRAATEGERAFLREFGGGCNVPAGCHIWWAGSDYSLLAVVGDDSGRVQRFSASGGDPVALGLAAAAALQ